jgi:hypothetical protein
MFFFEKNQKTFVTSPAMHDRICFAAWPLTVTGASPKIGTKRRSYVQRPANAKRHVGAEGLLP